MENKENSAPNMDEKKAQVQEWLRNLKNEESHQEEAIPAMNTGYESFDAIHPLVTQSMAILLEGSEGAHEFDANTGTPQDFQPATQSDLQHQPAQLAGLKASSSYPHQPKQQQQELQSAPRFCSSRQAKTLQPAVQAASLQQPSSEQLGVIRYILSSQPYLSNPPPFATTGFYCTICSTSFDTKDQFLQHSWQYLGRGVKVFICWCGKLIAHFPKIISHLKKHTETSLCSLCGEDLLTLQYLHDHFNLHLKAGYLRCKHCKIVFLDEKSRLRHQDEAHPEAETKTKSGLRPTTQKRQSQQKDAIPVKIAREETIAKALNSFTLQSPTVIPSGTAFPFGTVTEHATSNKETVPKFQPTAEPHSQNKPAPDQVASTQSTSSYLQQSPQTCPTIKQEQQPSPPRSMSPPQPETLQPVVKDEFLEEPSLEEPVAVAPDTPAASQPVQPTPSPLPDTTGGFSCRTCSLDFAEKDQLIRHEMSHQHGTKLYLCQLCGEFSEDLPAAGCHCCSICGFVFLDQDGRLRHMKEIHNDKLQQAAEHE